MKKLLLLFTILSFSGLNQVDAQNMTCKELVAYRDNTLFRAWDKEFKKYDAYSFYRNTLVTEMQKLKSFKSNSKWGDIIMFTKTVTDVLNNTLALGQSMQVAKATKGGAEKLLERILVKKSDWEKEMAMAGGATIWEMAGDEVISAIPIINSLKATLDNLKTWKEFEKNKKHIESQLKNCESKLKSIEVKLKDTTKRMANLNSIKTQIDVYLRKNCK